MDLLMMSIFSISAEIKVGFTLEKPVSFLTSHIDKLGNDIFGEIGVPNSKVPDSCSLIFLLKFLLLSMMVNSDMFSCRFPLFQCSP
jgi:hypothetical protein